MQAIIVSSSDASWDTDDPFDLSVLSAGNGLMPRDIGEQSDVVLQLKIVLLSKKTE